MFIPTDLHLADGSSLRVSRWSAKVQPSGTDAGNAGAVPLVLVSSDDRPPSWDALAEYAGLRWRIFACHNPTANQLLQAIWSIGEPAVVCANGDEAAANALHAQSASPGAIPLAVLIDFGMSDDESPVNPGPGNVAIIRGRQSQVASHTDAVRARAAIGERCVLIELENCGDNAAESNPAEFESAISWLMFGE